jgi:hypothetical protein
MAQVCASPAEIATTLEDNPKTSTGAFILRSLPSCPWPLCPQHLTAPDDIKTHVCETPTAMLATPDEKLKASTGVN